MVDEAGDFMSLMGSTSRPCASGGRGFSFQSDAIRANAAERFRAARIAFLRKYPFRAMRERNLAPPAGGAFSCRPFGTLGRWPYLRMAQTFSFWCADPPPLKWSDLTYVFDIQEDCNGKEAIQA